MNVNPPTVEYAGRPPEGVRAGLERPGARPVHHRNERRNRC